jgi:ribosome biogenesis GTPase
MKALVLRGSRNVFTLRIDGAEIECPIKGKILKGVDGYYNPLAPGDIVETDGKRILGLEKRRNTFARFNQKGQSSQLLAANVDLALCITTPVSPPWRPRFVDRFLFQAEISGVSAALIFNKVDLDSEDPDTEERLEDFCRIGYPVYRVSALKGQGMKSLCGFLKGKTSVFVGQSGVGKSSLINALIPGQGIRTGTLNEKYDRGNHTTTQGMLMDASCLGPLTFIIDTPGIRRLAPERTAPEDVIHYMKEFAPLAFKCSFGFSCTHKTEPGCKIMEAVHAGVIHEDRYESFLRIRDEMSSLEQYPDYD